MLRPDYNDAEDHKLADMSRYPEKYEKGGVTMKAQDLQRFKEMQIKSNDGESHSV